MSSEKSHAASIATRPKLVQAVILGGLTVGVLDAIFAVVLYKAPATVIFQSIASGLLGRETAFGGGLGTAALGFFLHFFNATSMAAVYAVASIKLPALVRRAVPCGMAYGVAIYLFMNYVVIPLSAMRQGKFNLRLFVIAVIGHMFLVGLPIALFTRRAAGSSAASAIR